MNGAQSRIAALKPLLADIHRRLELGFGFRLWDGSTIPDNWPADALALAITDEGAIAALIKGPNVTTLANLWAAGRIDLKNGTLFDLAARRPKGRTRDLRKSLASLKTVRALAPFLIRAARGAMAARAYRPRSRKRRIGGRKQAQYCPSLRRLQCVLRALAGPGHGLHLRLLSRLERWPRRGAAAEARHGLPQASPRAGRDDARHRQRLGIARLPRGRALRRKGSRA